MSHRPIGKTVRPYCPSRRSAHSATNPSRFGQTPITLIDSRHSGPGYKYKGLQQFGALSICTVPLASEFETQTDQPTSRANPSHNGRERCMPLFLLEFFYLHPLSRHWCCMSAIAALCFQILYYYNRTVAARTVPNYIIYKLWRDVTRFGRKIFYDKEKYIMKKTLAKVSIKLVGL